ncbi:polysaccharide pyruvyl transferase family protein [Inquilinus limosus]|uniref:polysaccharide pyruvyl transferase family protein n=1 Tax=Inquilinus limosus TaxID=171674 RepID=UPI00047E7CE5|nr:polysaccharide pyruvyl transferase family protein [Inquilinus limosus]
MDYLKDRLSVIDKYIEPGSKVIYIDYPMHLNVGDILILKGTEAFFKDRKYDVVGRYSTFGFPEDADRFPQISKDTTIVLHGGGNFGDIYQSHQVLRRKVVEHYPDNRIVVFPQTLFFSDETELRRTAEVFSRHRDLHFFARDQRTYDVFRREFSNTVEMCPDMAHFLWRSFPVKTYGAAAAKLKTLWMIRRDVEQSDLPEQFRGTVERAVDWEDLCTGPDRFLTRLILKADRINARVGRKRFPTDIAWYRFTDALVARLNRQILQHDRIVTSRMHGHILGCLLGMKTTLLDNSYGKNSTYYRAWTNRVENCDLVEA